MSLPTELDAFFTDHHHCGTECRLCLTHCGGGHRGQLGVEIPRPARTHIS